MFIGSFYRVPTKADMEKPVSYGLPIIFYVEEEHKLYEKNNYGMINEYKIDMGEVRGYIDHTDEITDMEERIYALEQKMKELNKGGIYEV